MPTALERAGDFSQTRTSSGALIVVRDPLTGQPFPGNVIPANRADARGLAMLNLLPLPNTTGVGYNFVDQEASIPAPAAPAPPPARLPPDATRTACRSRGRPGSPTASGSTSPAPRRDGASSASATTSRPISSRPTTPASSTAAPSSKRASASSTAPSWGRPQTTPRSPAFNEAATRRWPAWPVRRRCTTRST